jgi:hypothetical protein
MAATISSMPAPIRDIGTLAVSNSWGHPALARPGDHPLAAELVQGREAARSTTGGCRRASITLVPSLTRSDWAATKLAQPLGLLGDPHDVPGRRQPPGGRKRDTKLRAQG